MHPYSVLISSYVLALLIGLVPLALAQSSNGKTEQDACPEQLITSRAVSANYSNDYSRKVNELSQVQTQLYLAQQRIKVLEEKVKKLEKPNEANPAPGGGK